MSAGFVMANIGLSCSPEAIGATKANTWHIPIDRDGDAFGPLEQFFSNPLQENGPTPAFITFPSLKVRPFRFLSFRCCRISIADCSSSIIRQLSPLASLFLSDHSC